MGYNTVDVNDYIKLLSDITKIDIQSVYVIVYKNFYRISTGEVSVSDAYLNITDELTKVANKGQGNLVPKSA